MAKSYRKKQLEAQRRHQAAYRERMRLEGWKQITVWLDPEVAKAVAGLKGVKLSEFISQAINAFTGKAASKLTSNLSDKLTSKVTSNVPQAKLTRYMSAELEDKILQLREGGLSLQETARRLADEGFMSATGKPYGTSTVSKAEKRARRRKG